MSFIDELLAHNPNPSVNTAIDLVSWQWVDMKAGIDERLLLSLSKLQTLTHDDVWELYEASHILRELIGFTLTAVQRRIITVASTVGDMIDEGIYSEFTETDLADISNLFGLPTLDLALEVIVSHPLFATCFRNGLVRADACDIARLTSSIIYHEYAEPGFTMRSTKRFGYLYKTLSIADRKHLTDPERLLRSWCTSIVKPVKDWSYVNLAIERGILISGRV